ncbi:uncharacterized protein LOC9643394 [Selaginella moellendorffii]|nr:uncharacterized protein LOC9643394 [Selaginella moellendorffii]|eukprot:XP_002963184.2 uncharacterized protein LOC9643394 [Selaginella moellendorffii]
MDSVVCSARVLGPRSVIPSFRPHCQPQRQRTQQRFRLSIVAVSSNDFKTGTEIEIDNAPWRVIEFLHVKPGKGSAFVRTKLKNCITGNTVERTFRAGEVLEDATVQKNVKQFTYRDGDQYVFMDMVSFEESRLNAKEIGDKANWLREGMDCTVVSWKNRILEVDLPIAVKYKVVQTDPGVKGNRESGGTKPATLDTGAVVNVPLFVDEGEEIIIDTRTGEYMSRAKS